MVVNSQDRNDYGKSCSTKFSYHSVINDIISFLIIIDLGAGDSREVFSRSCCSGICWSLKRKSTISLPVVSVGVDREKSVLGRSSGFINLTPGQCINLISNTLLMSIYYMSAS